VFIISGELLFRCKFRGTTPWERNEGLVVFAPAETDTWTSGIPGRGPWRTVRCACWKTENDQIQYLADTLRRRLNVLHNSNVRAYAKRFNYNTCQFEVSGSRVLTTHRWLHSIWPHTFPVGFNDNLNKSSWITCMHKPLITIKRIKPFKQTDDNEYEYDVWMDQRVRRPMFTERTARQVGRNVEVGKLSVADFGRMDKQSTDGGTMKTREGKGQRSSSPKKRTAVFPRLPYSPD